MRLMPELKVHLGIFEPACKATPTAKRPLEFTMNTDKVTCTRCKQTIRFHELRLAQHEE